MEIFASTQFATGVSDPLLMSMRRTRSLLEIVFGISPSSSPKVNAVREYDRCPDSVSAE